MNDVPLAIEREIGGQAGNRLGLRFDKSVVRLISGLKSSLAETVPEGEALILSVTAPIRLRAKTTAVLEDMIRQGTELPDTVNGNQVRLRRLTNLPANRPKMLGFVHNPTTDAGTIFALAEDWLRKRT